MIACVRKWDYSSSSENNDNDNFNNNYNKSQLLGTEKQKKPT